MAYNVRWSSDGKILAMACLGRAPWIALYRREGDTLVQLPTPPGAPTAGTGTSSVSWANTSEGEFLSITNNAAPVITTWRREADDTFTRLPDPSPAITGNAPYCIEWSPDGTHLAMFSPLGNPNLRIMKRIGMTQGMLTTGMPPLANAPRNLFSMCWWTPDSRFLSYCTENAAGVGVETFERSGDQFTKVTNFSAQPVNALALRYTADGKGLVVQTNEAPYVQICSRPDLIGNPSRHVLETVNKTQGVNFNQFSLWPRADTPNLQGLM
jgi:hypothetical protein